MSCGAAELLPASAVTAFCGVDMRVLLVVDAGIKNAPLAGAGEALSGGKNAVVQPRRRNAGISSSSALLSWPLPRGGAMTCSGSAGTLLPPPAMVMRMAS